MNNIETIITVASWEERFLLGMLSSIERFNPQFIICFFYKEYSKRTEENRSKLQEVCKQKKITLSCEELNFAQEKDNWNKMDLKIKMTANKEKGVLVDITTMPRDTIYNTLYFLDELKMTIHYIYYKPDKYNDSWLSRDPAKPRLILKHSGISKLGANTVLVIITGFDTERTEQLINFFEPSLTIFGFQEGTQFNTHKLNLTKHKTNIKQWEAQTEIKTFKIDAYSSDNGFSILARKIKRYIKVVIL